MTSEIKDKLAKVEANSKSKTDQIASLVRMIFTQKRERIVFSKEERETIYDEVLSSVDFTDEEKQHYQECRDLLQSLSPSTVDDLHQGVCDKIEPLYNLQKERVMSSLLLGADGSPFPILDCEKHKTVNHYLIQYRSVQSGIPIFLVNTNRSSLLPEHQLDRGDNQGEETSGGREGSV